ncbi:MAG: hypothetical protein GY845_28950 [Planctomycetes bacterium]|nr:hypothetical protein [Planctomycetota bacterium]
MKQLILFASMMLSVTSYSQWERGNYVDDFGEKTEEVFFHQTVSGTFSNSASTNAKCAYFIEHSKVEEILAISIYPYGRSIKESFYDDTFQDVKIKKPSGEVVTIEAFCFDGMIYFSEEEYVQLMDALKEKGEYKVAMTYKTDYAQSSYRFKFNN